MNTETEYGWDAFDRRIAALEAKIDALYLNSKLSTHEQRVAMLEETLERFEAYFDYLEKDGVLGGFNARIAALEAVDHWNNFGERIAALESIVGKHIESKLAK